VTIREVGPRDGLQSERPLSVEARVRLIDALSVTGVPKLEAVSFVSPRAVPAMANAEEVWAGAMKIPGVLYSALVPNRRGAETAARMGGFGSLQSFMAVSEGYNRKNVGKSVEESIADVIDVAAVGRRSSLPVEVSISAAFGDPYEGDVSPRRVLALARRLVDEGIAGISLGDTTGMATPSRVWDVVGLFHQELPETPLNLHFHDTRGASMANVLAALEMGVTEFDASVGGVGGSPFAPGAAGNVPTEDLVHMLADMGIETGIDLERLLEAAKLLESLVDHGLPGRVSRAGPRLGGPGAPSPENRPIEDSARSRIESRIEIPELLATRRDQILEIAARNGVVDIRVFGSVVRGEAGRSSDIDFLVELEPGRTLIDLGGLLVELERLLGRPVDVVTAQGLRRSIRAQVLREATTL
jgi:hydroxymethylglutaryl-CoA lyase